MATTDERVDKLETKFATLSEQFAATMAKVDSFVEESKQQREDMRRLNERQDAMQAQHNAEVKGALKHIQNLTIAAMVGIAAIAGATWAFMWSSTRNETPPQIPPAQTAQAATQNHEKTNSSE